MKQARRDSASKPDAAGTGATAGSVGKQPRVPTVVFGAGAVEGQDAAPVAPDRGPETADGDGAVPLDEPAKPAKPAKPADPPKPTVTMTFPESAAPPLTFSAPDYRDLYKQVAARVGKEAGSVEKTVAIDTQPRADGTVASAALTVGLATMLPAWPERASQPKADQAKFDTWRASVSAHEAEHRAIYKREYPKLKAQIAGPTKDDVYRQADVISDAVEKLQDAFDASNQPAPLAIPGGMEKVQSTDASDVAPPSDTAVV